MLHILFLPGYEHMTIIAVGSNLCVALLSTPIKRKKKLCFYSLKGFWASGWGPLSRAPLAFAACRTWLNEASWLSQFLLASQVYHSLARDVVPKRGVSTFWGRDSHSHVMWARVGCSPHHGGWRIMQQNLRDGIFASEGLRVAPY